MKKISTTLIFVTAIAFSLFSQKIINLDNNVSFVTDKKGVEIGKISDAALITGNNKKIVSHNYAITKGYLDVSFHKLTKEGNNSYEYYSIEGTKERLQKNSKQKDYDTIYFLADYSYGFGLGPTVYLGRPENTSGVYIPIWLTDTTGYFTGIDSDTLDIMACLWKLNDFSIVFINNYIFDHTDTVYLSDTMAQHPIVLDPVKEDGESIFGLQGEKNTLFALTYTLSNGIEFTSGWELPDNINYYTSDYTSGIENMYFGSSVKCTYMGSFPSYVIQFEVPDTITDSIYLTNPPDSLVSVVSNFSYYHKRDYNYIGIASLTKHMTANGSGISGTLTRMKDYAHPYWEGGIHTYNFNSPKMRFVLQHYIDYQVNGQNHFYIASPIYDEYNGKVAGYEGFSPNADVHCFAPTDTIFAGKGLLYYWNMWQITNGVIRVNAEKMGMWGNWIYPMEKEDAYILKDSSGSVVASGTGLEIEEYVADKAPYTLLQINSFSHFNGVTGRTTITSHMDLSKTDRTPPIVYNIYFINGNNTMKYQFDDGEQVKLRFTACDFTTYNNNHTGLDYHELPDSLTKVWIKRRDSEEWLDAEVQKIYGDSVVGSVYEADLTDLLDIDSTLYDLKISVTDKADNGVNCVFLPGFVYGAFTLGDAEKRGEGETGIDIYPNPVNGMLSVNIENGAKYEYEIYTGDGRKVLGGVTTGKSIDVSGISKGIYIITFRREGRYVSVRKFVKSGL
jgi:hypothetical protein